MNNNNISFGDACDMYNIPKHLNQSKKERLLFTEIFREYKIPEYFSDAEKREKYKLLQNMIRTPLFRYRKVQEHNINALKGGYISVSMPDMMGTTGDDFDSQITIDYEKVQSEFSLHLNLDIEYFANWAFKGIPFPEDKLKMLSQNVRDTLVNSQGLLKGNVGLKPMMIAAQTYIKNELTKLTPCSGVETLDILQKTGYIACFCEDVCKANMWKCYATDNQNQIGYALEYDFKSLSLDYHKSANDKNFIILPTVYGEEYNATELIVFTLINEWFKKIVKQRPLKMPDELSWIKGYFYKHEKFEQEDEWRLVTPIKGMLSQGIIGAEQADKRHSKVYVPPKAIYYGLGISDENFKMLDEIAINKKLTRYKMVEDDKSSGVKPVLIEM